MDNYPLHQNKFNPNALEPINAYITEEYIEKQYKLTEAEKEYLQKNIMFVEDLYCY